MANFIKVPDEIMLSSKLSLHEKILMSVLLYYDRLVKWGKYEDIHPNQTTLSEQCNMSVKSVNRTIKSLKDKRYIKTTQKVNRSSLVYELNTKMVRTESPTPTSESPSDRTESPKGSVTESQRLGLRVPLGTTRKDYKELDIKKIEKSSANAPFIREVLDYLNTKLGTKYQAKSGKTKTLISTRIKEGYTVKDFITVIDKKYLEWHNDPGMSKFLRPETLFGNKFESYLNQIGIKQDDRPRGREIR